MEIQVNCRSKGRRALIEAAAAFYAQELKLNKSKTKLVIDNVSGFSKETGYRGAVAKMGKGVLAMALDSRLESETLFNTLAHEMVHVKQYALGQLDVVAGRKGTVNYKWLGRINKNEYFDCPWEVEAFSRERLLANKIIKLLTKV